MNYGLDKGVRNASPHDGNEDGGGMKECPGQTGERQFLRQDWVTAVLLLLIAFLVRVPFRSQMAYHWDSAQFALAINHYDIRVSQPHAPAISCTSCWDGW